MKVEAGVTRKSFSTKLIKSPGLGSGLREQRGRSVQKGRKGRENASKQGKSSFVFNVNQNQSSGTGIGSMLICTNRNEGKVKTQQGGRTTTILWREKGDQGDQEK